MTTKEIFTDIKNRNLWGSSESISGPGSEIKQTHTLIKELPKLFKSKGIKSILDIPCGDFNWMKEVDLSSIEYVGADIVDSLIIENNEKYGSETINFLSLNIITDILPRMDMILVRDCFVHFSYHDIQNAICNIKRSGCKYLLTTTFLNYYKNYDIITGNWRRINFQAKPFNFPEPEFTLVENCTEGNGIFNDKAMGLWLIENVEVSYN